MPLSKKRVLGTLGVAALAGCAFVVPGRADDGDIFGITAGGIQPNVLLLIDSSGSMNGTVNGERKIDTAKAVVTDLILNTPDVLFGAMIFHSGGGDLIGPVGTDVATLAAAINGIALTSVGTPLGDQLYDAGEYYEGNTAPYPNPIDYKCQLNYVIIISDGQENGSTRPVVDEATDRYTQDHSSTLAGLQNVKVHTIGFDLTGGDDDVSNDDVAAIQTLEQAASNGGGSFFLADNATELQQSLQILLNEVAIATFSFTAAVTPSTSTTGSTRAYVASFETAGAVPFWRGFLRAYARGANGLVPVDADGVPAAASLVWDAANLLATRTAGSRTIYTEIAGTRRAFTTGTAAITAAMLGVTSGERDDVMNFVRGADSYDHDGDGSTADERAWKLGDIFHSTPVLVSPPHRPTTDPDYRAFQQANGSRTGIVLVGANDGMLHAFRESDGVELWGFIPNDQLGRLKGLTPAFGTHFYFVDASPIVADVEIGGGWKTIAVFGERRGGNYYNALDITDTTDPQPLWSFTDARLGETWSEPAIGKVRLAGNREAWVAFVGGGYDTADNNATGDAVLAIDLATGTKLFEYWADGTTDDRRYMSFSIAAGPAILDVDRDGFIDRVYIGDVGGQLWRFDTSAAATTTGGLIDNWPGKRLFVADTAQANPPPAGTYLPAQAIYSVPAVAFDDDGYTWLYFGTGDRNNPKANSANRFYAIKDDEPNANGSALDVGDLIDVTTSDTDARDGWYIRLSSDEKVLSPADVFDGSVLFTTFTPSGITPCEGTGGIARLYALQMETGYSSVDWDTGEERGTTDASEPRSTEIGTGIPTGPTTVVNVDGGIPEANVVVSTTDEQMPSETTPAPRLREILYWREIF